VPSDDPIADELGAILAATMFATETQVPSTEPVPARQPVTTSPRPVVADLSASDTADPDEIPRPPATRRRLIGEWVGIVVLAVALALLLKTFVMQSFAIPSESMAPTLTRGDRVLVNKLSYRVHELRRGDVVVFTRPPRAPVAGPDDPADLIKRVIGLPGETLRTRNGSVEIDGRVLREPYLAEGMRTIGIESPVTLGPDEVFVLGDNRAQSADSRVFGPVDVDLVIGRAFGKVWPLGRIGFL
jgi:signal peptidase I